MHLLALSRGTLRCIRDLAVPSCFAQLGILTWHPGLHLRDGCSITGYNHLSLQDDHSIAACTSDCCICCAGSAAAPPGQPPEEKSVLQALQDLGSHFGREGSFGAAPAAAAAPAADGGSDAEPPRPRIGKVRALVSTQHKLRSH
jgi:hypothetical protein